MLHMQLVLLLKKVLLLVVVLHFKSKSCFKLKSDNADEATGIQIVASCSRISFRTIVENAGLEGSVVVAKVAEGKGDFGYNAKTDEYVDAKSGIIDPKSNSCSFENAASVAGMILTTECA
jgi:chaperonin GroEL